MFDRASAVMAICVWASLAAGCADSGGGGTPLLAPQGYTLNDEEKALDCRRLTGRMQVQLLALRGEDTKVQPTSASQAMRTATSTAFGTDTAKNAEARAASDRPRLEAYNNRLKELGCPSFDISKELAARPSAPTPQPTIAASGKKAK